MNLDQILDLPMRPNNDAGAATIRDYFARIALAVWDESEDFSGKRPFGNGGWWYEVYEALYDGGVLKATVDEWGHLEEFDSELADDLVKSAIMHMGRTHG